MKTIVCTGDSHTWGQGAAGLMQSFSPPPETGELRLAPFAYGCYVNLLRQWLNRCRKSFLYEADGTSVCGGQNRQEVLSRAAAGELIRLEFELTKLPVRLELAVGGEPGPALSVGEAYGRRYKLVLLHLHGTGKNPPPELELRMRRGNAALYRVESYGGEYAVINAGVGSCTTGNYLRDYWDEYVSSAHPSVVIIEAHTINDWLQAVAPEEYYKNLCAMIARTRKLGATPLLCSVSPIRGEQRNASGADYAEYIQIVEKAAAETGVLFADAHARFEQILSCAGPDHTDELFDDDWHVNDRGHEIYAQCIWDVLKKNRIL